MSNYTKRDIRAADMLALILIGLALVLVISAVLPQFAGAEGLKGWKGMKAVENAAPHTRTVGLWVAASVFLALGGALHLKVRQLVRNGGREPEDYAGVPE